MSAAVRDNGLATVPLMLFALSIGEQWTQSVGGGGVRRRKFPKRIPTCYAMRT